MRILDKDLDEKLRKLLTKYKFLERVLKEYMNEQNLIENTIIDTFREYDINELDGVKLTTQALYPKLTFGELKDHFSNVNSAFLDSLVISVDTHESIENLRYINGINEPILKSLKAKLNELTKESFVSLIVENGDDNEWI